MAISARAASAAAKRPTRCEIPYRTMRRWIGPSGVSSRTKGSSVGARGELLGDEARGSFAMILEMRARSSSSPCAGGSTRGAASTWALACDARPRSSGSSVRLAPGAGSWGARSSRESRARNDGRVTAAR